MSAEDKAASEMRKTARVDVAGVVCVTDRQSGRNFGRLVNISEEGIMILTTEPVTENAVFQLALEFCDSSDASVPVEIGVECLWSHEGSNPGQYWSGFYIIDISEQNQERIRSLLK